MPQLKNLICHNTEGGRQQRSRPAVISKGVLKITQTLEITRTTEEVFSSHRKAIETLNIEQLMADYAEDCLFVTPDDSFVGPEAILSGFFQAFLAQFPDARIIFGRVTIQGDICLIEWTSEASAMTVPVGLGVLFIQDGLIQRQVEWY